MSAVLKFTKMQACGNDFIVIDARHNEYNFSDLAIKLCPRRFSVGADGVIAIVPSRVAEFGMQYFNADGSAATCGNGIRCSARYVFEEGFLPKNKREFELETVAGNVAVQLHGSGARVTVDMGSPQLEAKHIPVDAEGEQNERDIMLANDYLRIHPLGMGNPHCVIFVDEPALLANVLEWGPVIEQHSFFPDRTNVEVCYKLDETNLDVRVWERGVGETLACGTGACAVLVAAVRAGISKRHANINMPGGMLEVHWKREDDRVYLTGPAERVYQGQIVLDSLT